MAATVLKNPKIQEAVVDKGLEVMNKLVDKQLRIIDEAQEKASNFLAKEVGKMNSKILRRGFRATLNFRKFKVALNPLRRIFKTLQKVASYHTDYNSIIKKMGVTELVFEL